MAQIIKHRRGLIGGVKNLTARNGELIIASGSISDLSGPFVFIGSPNTVDEGVAGAFNSVSKLYTGTAAPTITAATYGSALDGTPYYASGNKSLYILNNSNVGNSQIDLTGNIEGNTISGVTINKLESTNVTASYVSASFIGDGTGLYNVPASGVTGLELNQIGQGTVTASISEANGFNVNTNSAITGTLNVNGNTSVTGTFVATDGSAFINQGVISQNSNLLLTSGSNLIIENGGNANIAGDVIITGSEYVDTIFGKTNSGNYLAFNGGGNGAPDVELESQGNISLWAEGGTVNVTGSFIVIGDIVFSGSINIGDYSGDTVNFQGEISSSIVPQVNNAFSLGASGSLWSDVWATNAHFTNISLNTIAFDGLTEGRALFVGGSGSLKDDATFTFDSGSGYLSAPIINATSDGSGSNFLVGNDMWIGDINESNAMKFKGATDSSVAKVYFNDTNSNNYVEGNGNTMTIQGGNRMNVYSQGDTFIEAYDGNIYLSDDSSAAINLQGNTYLNTNRTLYASNIRDNNNNNNRLELYGYGTDDGYWWESGNGNDTTLLNWDDTGNVNILKMNDGNINIDSRNGSVNIHTNNGLNVIGSLVVSDASGVFNSSLNVSNSDLTLSGGSNVHMDDNAHLYFDTCIDIYYDNNNQNLVFYNDCNSFQFQNAVAITGSLNVDGDFYTDNVYGRANNNNQLNLNGGGYGAPNVELKSDGQISLFAEGNTNSSDINMTGSVHMQNNLDVSGSIYVGEIYNYNNDINGGGIYVDSGNYTEISYNDEQVYFGVDAGGIWGYSNSGTNSLTSNAGNTEINANNGYNVNINANNILLSGGTAVTGAFTVSSGSMTSLGGDLYVSGNLQVLGSSTNVSLQSNTVDIGDNIIQVNAYSPFDRYAGLAAYDSGSSGASGSFLWDSVNDYWLIVNANSYTSKIIGTTASTGSTGTEISLTSGTFPIATASNTIGDSLLTFSGTTLAYNTNKFTVDSGTGATAISGNLTLSYSGGTDNGTKTSAVTFRNSSNVLGFVSTVETTNELDGILGYNTTTGVLEFSTLIDGGTY